MRLVFFLVALRVEKDRTQRCSSRVRRNPVFPQRRRNQGGASPSSPFAARTAGSGAQGKGGARRRAAVPAAAARGGESGTSRTAGRGAARRGARRRAPAFRCGEAAAGRPAPPRPGPRSRGARGHGAGPAPLLSGAEARGLGRLGAPPGLREVGGRSSAGDCGWRRPGEVRGRGEPGDTGRATRGRTGAGARSPASGIPSAGAAWSLMAGHATRGAGESSRIRSLGALLLPAGSPAKPVGRGAVQAPRGASGTAAGSRRGPRVPLPEAPAGAALLRAAHPPRPAEGPRSRRAPRSPRPPRRAAWASAGLPGGRDQEELPAAGYVRVPPVSSA